LSATNDAGVKRYALPGVPDPILPADVANKNYVDTFSMERRENFLQVGTASTHTITINPVRTVADTVKVEVIISGQSDGAAVLRADIGALGDWDIEETINDSGVGTFAQRTADAFIPLIPSALLDTARNFYAELIITIAAGRLTGKWFGVGGAEGHILGSFRAGVGGITTIGDIIISLSANDWIANTRITTYIYH